MQAAHNDLECLAADRPRAHPICSTPRLAAQLLGLPSGWGWRASWSRTWGTQMRKGHGQADWSRAAAAAQLARVRRARRADSARPRRTNSPRTSPNAGKTAVGARRSSSTRCRQRPAPDPQMSAGAAPAAPAGSSTDAQRGVLRALWLLRDEIASSRDIAVHRDRTRPPSWWRWPRRCPPRRVNSPPCPTCPVQSWPRPASGCG
jgi:hypothetical protein